MPATERPSLLRRLVACSVLAASVGVTASSDRWWVVAAFAVTLVDVFVLKPLLVRWGTRSRRMPEPVLLLATLVVWPVIPAAWVGCAVGVVTGSAIAGSVVGVLVGLALLLQLAVATDRFRRQAARGRPVAPKKRQRVPSR